MQQPAVLSVKHLQKVFFPGTANERHVLKNVSLEITPGDFVAVIGNNGAGKSTLLNTIAGTLPVDAGEMTLAGHRVTKKSVAYRANGYRVCSKIPRWGRLVSSVWPRISR